VAEEKQTNDDLLERAREAARCELDALRDEPEQPKQPKKRTLLTGYERYDAHLPRN